MPTVSSLPVVVAGRHQPEGESHEKVKPRRGAVHVDVHALLRSCYRFEASGGGFAVADAAERRPNSLKDGMAPGIRESASLFGSRRSRVRIPAPR
jgi:hypothetical protein